MAFLLDPEACYIVSIFNRSKRRQLRDNAAARAIVIGGEEKSASTAGRPAVFSACVTFETLPKTSKQCPSFEGKAGGERSSHCVLQFDQMYGLACVASDFAELAGAVFASPQLYRPFIQSACDLVRTGSTSHSQGSPVFALRRVRPNLHLFSSSRRTSKVKSHRWLRSSRAANFPASFCRLRGIGIQAD